MRGAKDKINRLIKHNSTSDIYLYLYIYIFTMYRGPMLLVSSEFAALSSSFTEEFFGLLLCGRHGDFRLRILCEQQSISRLSACLVYCSWHRPRTCCEQGEPTAPTLQSSSTTDGLGWRQPCLPLTSMVISGHGRDLDCSGNPYAPHMPRICPAAQSWTL